MRQLKRETFGGKIIILGIMLSLGEMAKIKIWWMQQNIIRNKLWIKIN